LKKDDGVAELTGNQRDFLRVERIGLNVNCLFQLAHPQFFLTPYGLSGVDLSCHLANPSSRLHKADFLESSCNLTEEHRGLPYNGEIHVPNRKAVRPVKLL